jgi:hypothetical protein
MFVSSLDSLCLLHVGQALLHAAHVDEREPLVEQNLGGKESELEAELFIIAITG